MMKRYVMRTLAVVSLLLLAGAGVGLVAFQAQGGKLLSIQSGSMEPAMKKGGLVGVTPVSETDLRIGDVITFINPADENTTITHRVAALDGQAGQRIITKGDANALADAPISDAVIVGRQRFYIPLVGTFLDFVRKPVGLLLLIYVPALTVIVSEMRKLAAYYKSREPYVLPELLARRRRTGFGGQGVIVAGLLASPLLSVGLPAAAALMSSATLGGTSITTAADPSVEPEPVVQGNVSIRRVFIVCEEGDDTATSVHIILYNSSRIDADVSNWTIASGGEKAFTLPPETVVPAHSTHDFKLPLTDGILYSSGTLILQNQDNEQISEITWEPQTRGDRECRVTSDRDVSGVEGESSRVQIARNAQELIRH